WRSGVAFGGVISDQVRPRNRFHGRISDQPVRGMVAQGEAGALRWPKFAQKGQRDEHRAPRTRAVLPCPADWCDLHVHVLLLSLERCRASATCGPDARQRSPRYRNAMHSCYSPLDAPVRAPSPKEKYSWQESTK